MLDLRAVVGAAVVRDLVAWALWAAVGLAIGAAAGLLAVAWGGGW